MKARIKAGISFAVALGLAGTLGYPAAMAQVGGPPAAQNGGGPGGPFGRGGRGGGGRGLVALDAGQLAELKARYIAPTQAPQPADNPSTPEKIALGQKLFFDPGLSGNGKIACASCHDARRGFGDRAALSLGVKGERLARHSPTVINLAWSEAFFLGRPRQDLGAAGGDADCRCARNGHAP